MRGLSMLRLDPTHVRMTAFGRRWASCVNLYATLARAVPVHNACTGSREARRNVVPLWTPPLKSKLFRVGLPECAEHPLVRAAVSFEDRSQLTPG